MKKLLIIQQDGVYFLEETFRVLEKFQASLKEFELTILVSSESLKEIDSNATPFLAGITTNKETVLANSYDISFNLSFDEDSWSFHEKVFSGNKVGFSHKQGQLCVPDLWSTFLLTIKANAPFLTFHLQDIYRNILGIKKTARRNPRSTTFKEVVFGNFNEAFLTLDEKGKILRDLKSAHPHLVIKNIVEVDLISDLSHTLYVGPATVESLRLGEAQARGLYLSRTFQGFNLLPHAGNHFVASTKGKILTSENLMPLINGMIINESPQLPSEYAVYEIEHENLYGAYLQSLNHCDNAYPFYQSHVVLWNFILNLFDVNLDISRCSTEQLELMKENQKVLAKIIRLHDYALSSIDTIYQELKSETSNAEKIDGHLKNLKDIDDVTGKVSISHPMLRPFLDYYRIRRGQNEGNSLLDQTQHTFLAYSEEHHALNALNELFTVTLRKNEVSI